MQTARPPQHGLRGVSAGSCIGVAHSAVCLQHARLNLNLVHAGCAHVCVEPSVEKLQPAPVDRDVIVKLDPIKHDDDQINSSLSGSQDAMI